MQWALTTRNAKRIVLRMDQIFALWPSLADLAADLRKPYQTVASWRQRGSIPARYDQDIVRAAAARGKELTFEDLARARALGLQSSDAA